MPKTKPSMEPYPMPGLTRPDPTIWIPGMKYRKIYMEVIPTRRTPRLVLPDPTIWISGMKHRKVDVTVIPAGKMSGRHKPLSGTFCVDVLLFLGNTKPRVVLFRLLFWMLSRLWLWLLLLSTVLVFIWNRYVFVVASNSLQKEAVVYLEPAWKDSFQKELLHLGKPEMSDDDFSAIVAAANKVNILSYLKVWFSGSTATRSLRY